MRLNGASGGLTTWLLCTLLEKRLVDYVITVAPTETQGRLFEYRILDKTADVKKCSKSAYYPTEMSKVLRHICTHPSRYAIVGLPCVCKAVRQAMQLYPRLATRIKYILGLACHQNKSKFYVEYICTLRGGDPKGINKIRTRIKDPRRSASDFGIAFSCGEDHIQNNQIVTFMSEGMSKIWCDRYFTLNGCNFCDDIFSELADACFMDAWLSPYKQDYRGHSIMLIRDKRLLKLIEEGKHHDYLKIDLLPINKVIRSQRGTIFEKRQAISERLAQRKNNGLLAPPARVDPRTRLRYDQRLEIRAKLHISQRSSKAWLESYRNIKRFKQIMLWPRTILWLISLGRRFLKRVIRRVPKTA